jgi:hypothetical protein
VPDALGRFLFDPGRGGGRIDKVRLPADDFRLRYVQASRFGEVNAYFHVDRIAGYVDALLGELAAPSLPPAIVVVNAHHAAVEDPGGRDGRRCPDGRHVPFQGGHYRLPGPTTRIPEKHEVAATGEIHLGPGQKLSAEGSLARMVGGGYRVNASHNAGIIYHEYGHHISRHTADFRGNATRLPHRQSNRKAGLDEGFADYWTAVMLGTPDIWFFHHRHDDGFVHRRSLRSGRTMADYRRGAGSDPHSNGTIWAAALWQLRTAVERVDPQAAGRIDRVVLGAMLLLGRNPRPVERRSFATAALALRDADATFNAGRWQDLIARTLASRGLDTDGASSRSRDRPTDRASC